MKKHKRRTRASVAAELIAALQVVRRIVTLFAAGTLRPTLSDRVSPQNVRIAPYFSRRADPSATGVRYSTKSITDAVATHYGTDLTTVNGTSEGKIRRTANLYIRTAILLQEGIEEGWVSEHEVLDAINRRLPGFGINALLKRLRNTRQDAQRETKRAAREMVKVAVGDVAVGDHHEGAVTRAALERLTQGLSLHALQQLVKALKASQREH